MRELPVFGRCVLSINTIQTGFHTVKNIILSLTAGIGLFQFASASISTSEYDSLRSYFQSLHGSTSLPVAGITLDDVESTFGPRIQASTDLYDFHRGIDIDGDEGDNVLAVTGGVFWEYRVFPAGGNTVILRHAFDAPKTINGKLYNYYFTYYMHLWDDEIPENGLSTDDLISGWVAEKTNPNQGTVVAVGQHVGEMGNSGSSGGDPYADHLHMELRAGTTNSLEYQTNNNQLGTYGFDPHLHPLLFYAPYTFGGPDYSPEFSIEGAYQNGNDVVFLYSSNDEQPLVNRFEVRIVSNSDDSIAKEHTLDFNLRTGYNASSNAALVIPTVSTPYIDPVSFGDASDVFQMRLVIPDVWLDGFKNGTYRLEICSFDIWGNETPAADSLLSNAIPSVPEPSHAVLILALVAAVICTRKRHR